MVGRGTSTRSGKDYRTHVTGSSAIGNRGKISKINQKKYMNQIKGVPCFYVYMTVLEKGFSYLPWVPLRSGDLKMAQHWSPQKHWQLLFFLSFLPECKWWSYFSFMESCLNGVTATQSQHKAPLASKLNSSLGDNICHLSSRRIYQAWNRPCQQPNQHSRHHNPPLFQLTYFQPVFTRARDKLSFDLKWTISLNTCIPNESSLPCPSLIFALCLSCY